VAADSGGDAAGQRWFHDENADENADRIGLPFAPDIRDRGSTPREPGQRRSATPALLSLPVSIWEVCPMHTEVLDQSAGGTANDFDLDVTIVEFGDAADVLLRSTDNGCSTNKTVDC
jgi:FxLD family lantipeptide